MAADDSDAGGRGGCRESRGKQRGRLVEGFGSSRPRDGGGQKGTWREAKNADCVDSAGGRGEMCEQDRAGIEGEHEEGDRRLLGDV
jgi:hypothetical protein